MSLPIRVGHLGKWEAIALLSIAGFTNAFLNAPTLLVESGLQAGWMIPIGSMVIMLAVFLLISRPLQRMLNRDFLAVSDAKWARIVAGILAVVTILYLFLLAASEIRQITETTLGTVLSKSPLSFVATPLLLVIIYFAFSGVEAITRVAWLFLPIFLIGIGILLLGDYNWMHMEYLSPILGAGWGALGKQSLFYTCLFPNLLFLVIVIGALREKSDVTSTGIWSIIIVGFIYALVTLVYVSIFPYLLSIHLAFPLYQLARIISIGRFFERLESGFIFLWVACAVLKVSFTLWAATYLSARVFGMSVYRPLVFSTAIVIYSISFLPRSYPEVVSLDALLEGKYGFIFTLGVPLLIVLLHLTNRRERHEKKLRRAS
jgi:spore germination protein KB